MAMVKLVQDSRSPEGFPHLRWEQVVPTGQSVHSAEQSIELWIASIAMAIVFVLVFSGTGDFWISAFAALFIGGAMLSGDQMFKGGITVWDVHIKGPEPRPGKAEREAVARATAMMRKEHCEAVVMPHRETQELYFWVFRGTKPSKMECIAGVPVASIQAFELGTAEEWFMDVAQAQLRRQLSAPNSWVIVAPSLGQGVVPVAESGGGKAGIAALHGLLTRRFVLEAPEMQERWKAKLEAAKTEHHRQS